MALEQSDRFGPRKPANHIFQSFWFGDPLSPYEWMCLRSFVDHGHGFHLYTYSSQLEVPAGVELKDAAELLDQSEYFTHSVGKGIGSPAPFSDLFRYKLLAQRGGWWVDTDVVCLTSQIPSFDEFFARHTDDHINNAVLLFKRGDPLMWDCYNEAARIRGDGDYCTLGPTLFTRKLEECGRAMDAHPHSTAFPIHFRDALDVLRPNKAEILTEKTSGSIFLHLYNEVYRRANVSKAMLPPRGSLLREIAYRFPVDGWRGEYDADFLEQTLNMQTEHAKMKVELALLRKKANKRRNSSLPGVARKVATEIRKLVTRLQSMLAENRHVPSFTTHSRDVFQPHTLPKSPKI